MLRENPTTEKPTISKSVTGSFNESVQKLNSIKTVKEEANPTKTYLSIVKIKKWRNLKTVIYNTKQ